MRRNPVMIPVIAKSVIMMEAGIMREAEGVMAGEGNMIRMRDMKQRHDHDKKLLW